MTPPTSAPPASEPPLAPPDEGLDEVQRLRRRLKEIATVSALSQGFARGGDHAHMLQRVAEGAAELMDCEIATVLIHSPERHALEVAAAAGAGEDLVGALLPLEGSLAGRVVQSGRPRMSMEPGADALSHPAGAGRLRNTLIVPLMGSTETFGALSVSNRRQPGSYRPHEIALLLDLAHHAEAAIEARHTLEALRRQVAESNALAEVGRAVTSTLALGGVLSLVLREAEALVSAECSSVALLEGRGAHLSVLAATGALHPSIGGAVPVRGSLIGQAVERREPALTDALCTAPDAPGAAAPQGPAAAVPLVVAGNVRGALLVVRAPGAPPILARDVNALRKLAAFAAIAIDNARLYNTQKETADALQSRVGLLSALLETGNRLRLEMDVEVLLQTICEAICSVLGWRSVLLSLRDYERGISRPVAAAGLTPERRAEILASPPAPIRPLDDVTAPELRISNSFFLDHTHLHTTGSLVQLIHPEVTSADEALPPGAWHPCDALMVPIELRGTVLGFISPDEPRSGRVPTLDEVQALELFANQAAIAIDNVRLYQAQKDMADVLRTQQTELEHAYQTLHQSQEQLLVSEKMAALGRITAGIAHEINSPLGGILNSLELARSYAEEYRDSAGDAEVTAEDHRAIAGDLLETLALAEGATRKVAQFVRSIKAQTRTAEGAPRSVFDPQREVDATLTLLHHQLRDTKTTLHLEAAAGLELEGDPGKFALLVQNLLSNAIDAYEGCPGEVWLRLYRHEDAVLLEVEDRGCGIREELRGRIFDYLFTTKEVGRGTGLGLSMAHNIVSAHFSGEITLQSKVGAGTTFRVRLPALATRG